MYFFVFTVFCAVLVLAVLGLGKVFDHYEKKNQEDHNQ